MASVDIGIDGLTDAAPIGSGGNAVVYRAYDADHDRWVAVKLLRGLGDEAELRRFDRERRTMGRLSEHEGIVTIHSSGINDRGEPFIVMSLLEQGSLQDRIDQSGSVAWPEAVEIMATVSRTVHAAHLEGVVHRDLKPANIMLSGSGYPLVADFGIARHVGSSASIQSTSITMTPAYSPPEVIEGAEATPSADVYALGATLFALIVGSPPFVTASDENMFALLLRVSKDPVRDLRPEGVPDFVCAAIERAMAKSPDDRPVSAAGFANAIDPDSSNSFQQSSPATVVATASPPKRPSPATDMGETITPQEAEVRSDRRGLRLATGAAVLVVGLVAAVGVIVLQSRGNDEVTTAPGGLSEVVSDAPDLGPGSIIVSVGEAVLRIPGDGSDDPTDLSAAFDGLSLGADQWVVSSRNGEWLVLDTERFGCEDWSCLVVARSDVSDVSVVRVIGDAVHSQDRGAISDDGSVLVVTSDTGPNALDLVILRRTGDEWSSPVVITGESPWEFNERGRLSGDESAVLFDCGPTQYGLEGTGVCRVQLDGDRFLRLISPEDGPDGDASNVARSVDEAPDGSLVFAADWGGSERLWRRSLDGSFSLVSGLGNDTSPCVLPDGSVVSLWFERDGNDDGLPELKVQAFGSADHRMLLTGVDALGNEISCSG